MKAVLAAALLLFQLQPLVGTVVCLSFSVEAAQQQCEMPDHAGTPFTGIAEKETPPPNCALTAVCAPSPLAIASLPELLQTVVDLRAESSMMAASTLFSISSAPPFHPPRA
jgi:hypothetical protein